MSYSIGKTASTKEELETGIRYELAKVREGQPVHETDINQAIETSAALIGLMKNDPDRDLRCSVSGSIWQKDEAVQQISLSVNVNVVDRAAPAAA